MIARECSIQPAMVLKTIIVLCLTVINVLGDLPPGTRRNTYLPPEPTKGYNYNTPSVPFPRPTPGFPSSRPTSPFPVGPTRPTPTFPTGPSRPPTQPGRPGGGYPTPGPRPTPGFPTPTNRPTGGYPGPGPRPTPGFPDYPGQPSGNNGNTVPGHEHHHEPGMPFDFNYAVKEDAFGNDYSHNAISDGDIVKGEYRVQLPDGRTQIVRYTADWKHGFSAQVTYEGTPRLDLQRPPGAFRGY
ncbi:basic proline-rich protein-like isoform X1 [Microplitis mediator]|uniref:basic proline-rich protein-like isoform X1 n=1 Tax=Microplitis mediator TaxID=375433 RepID=UPI00255476AE|nr:basic proline-rich protein-like isoform X1 [Microplitis mediator]